MEERFDSLPPGLLQRLVDVGRLRGSGECRFLQGRPTSLSAPHAMPPMATGKAGVKGICRSSRRLRKARKTRRSGWRIVKRIMASDALKVREFTVGAGQRAPDRPGELA